MVLLAACAPSPIVPACVDASEAGDPIYRDCLIHAETPSSVEATRTDEEGRIVGRKQESGGIVSVWSLEWDGECLVYSRHDRLGTTSETRRTCDAAGNETSRVEISAGQRSSSTTEITYDAAGRPSVAVTWTEGEELPVTRFCGYTDDVEVCGHDFDDDGAADAWASTTRDAHGGELEWSYRSYNPGYSEWRTWERDSDGRTLVYTSYDTALSTTSEGVYTWDGPVLARIDWTATGVSTGTSVQTFSYEAR